VLLTIEIALGVLFGILLYRGLLWFGQSRNLTLPATVFAILLLIIMVTAGLGFIGLVGAALYFQMTRPGFLVLHRSEFLWGLALCGLPVLGFSFWQLAVQNKALVNLARESVCEKCGATGLRYRGDEIGRTEEWGPKYERAMGVCLRCGHAQELCRI
jgi:hypothetical protein